MQRLVPSFLSISPTFLSGIVASDSQPANQHVYSQNIQEVLKHYKVQPCGAGVHHERQRSHHRKTKKTKKKEKECDGRQRAGGSELRMMEVNRDDGNELEMWCFSVNVQRSTARDVAPPPSPFTPKRSICNTHLIHAHSRAYYV